MRGHQTREHQSYDWLIDLHLGQHNYGYMESDGRSQIKLHTDRRTQVHSAQSSLVVTHPSTKQARRYLTSVTEQALVTTADLPSYNAGMTAQTYFLI